MECVKLTADQVIVFMECVKLTADQVGSVSHQDYAVG